MRVLGSFPFANPQRQRNPERGVERADHEQADDGNHEAQRMHRACEEPGHPERDKRQGCPTGSPEGCEHLGAQDVPAGQSCRDQALPGVALLFDDDAHARGASDHHDVEHDKERRELTEGDVELETSLPGRRAAGRKEQLAYEHTCERVDLGHGLECRRRTVSTLGQLGESGNRKPRGTEGQQSNSDQGAPARSGADR